MLIIVTLDVLSAGAQGLILMVIHTTGRFFESSEQLMPFQDYLPEFSSQTWFILAVIVVFLLLAFSSIAAYAAVLRTRGIAREFHRKCAGRALDEFIKSPTKLLSRQVTRSADMQRLIVRNSIHLSKFLETLILLQQPVFRIFAVLFAVIAVDPALTAALVPLFVLFMAVMYSFSVNVQSDAKAFFEHGRKEMGGAVSGFISDINKTTVSGELYINPFLVTGHDPRIDRFFDLYDSIRLAASRATLRTMMFNAFMISGALLLYGILAFSEAREWSALAAYLTGLIILGTGITRIGGGAAILNRFYPQAVQYIQFIKQAEHLGTVTEVRDELSVAVINVTATTQEQKNSDQTIKISKGVPLVYLHLREITRITLSDALHPLRKSADAPTSLWNYIDLAVGGLPYTGLTFDVLISHAISNGFEEIITLSGIREQIKQLPGGEKTLISDESLALLPVEVHDLMKLFPAVSGRSPVALIDGRLLENLSTNLRDRILAAFNNRFLLIRCVTVYKNLDDNWPAIAVDPGRILFMGNVARLREEEKNLGLTKPEMPEGAGEDVTLEMELLE